jgi:ribosomal small subunit protein bTHX
LKRKSIINNNTMGRGDIKTKRGKIFAGSYGVSRPKTTTSSAVIPKTEGKAKKDDSDKKASTTKQATTAKKINSKEKNRKS